MKLNFINKLSFALIILIVLSAPVSAYSENADQIPGDLMGICQVCHIDPNGGGDLNSYGTDYMSNDYSFEDIAGLDSDNDGFTNQEELDAATLPGDPESSPEPEEPEGSPGFGTIGLAIGVLGALLLIKSRDR